MRSIIFFYNYKYWLTLSVLIVHISQSYSQVNLTIKDTGGNSLPYGSRIVVLTKYGTKTSLTNLPATRLTTPKLTFQVLPEDKISTHSKSLKTYLQTDRCNKVYFIYVLTKTGQLYYSSNGKAYPLFEVVQTGNIRVEELPNNDYRKPDIIRDFFQNSNKSITKKPSENFEETFLQIKDAKDNIVPKGSRIVVLQKNGIRNEVTSRFELPSKLTDEIAVVSEDRVDDGGKSINKYTKTKINQKIYFVYLLTSDNLLYYSSNGRGIPQFEKLEAGNIRVELIHPNNTHEKKVVLSTFFHDFFGEQDSQAINKNDEKTILFSFSIVILISAFLAILIRNKVKNKLVANFVIIGLMSGMLYGLVFPDPSLYGMRFPVGFAFIGFLLGFYTVLNLDKKMVDKLSILYAFTVLGFIYSVLFYLILEEAQAGKLLLIIPFVALAAGIFVYIFCIAHLSTRSITSTILISSLISVPLVLTLMISLDASLLVLVNYLFVSIIVILTYLIWFDTSHPRNILDILKTYGAIFLNYTIIFSIGSFFIYNEVNSDKDYLKPRNEKISLKLGVATFFVHLVFLVTYYFLGNLSLPFTEFNAIVRLINSIIWGLLIAYASYALGYSIFVSENEIV